MTFVPYHKSTIKHVHEFAITSKYYEFRKFRAFAAVHNDNKTTFGNIKVENGLIQVVSGNFDIHIHSWNDLNQIHGIATILAQSSTVNQHHTESLPIRRVKQEQLKDIKLDEIKIHFLRGIMTKNFVNIKHLSLKLLRKQKVLLQRVKEEQFQFLKCILGNNSTQAYIGFIMLKATDSI